jgi:hypothetical protein
LKERIKLERQAADAITALSHPATLTVAAPTLINMHFKHTRPAQEGNLLLDSATSVHFVPASVVTPPADGGLQQSGAGSLPPPPQARSLVPH